MYDENMISRLSSHLPYTLNRSFKTLNQRLKTKAPITFSSSAIQQINALLNTHTGDKGEPIGIRIGVKKRGCSGRSYVLNYLYEEDRQKYERDMHHHNGITYAIEPKSLWLLVGTEMDYQATALASEFTFNNPQAKGNCGCGESFHI